MKIFIRSSRILAATLLLSPLLLFSLPPLPGSHVFGSAELDAQQVWEGTIEGFDGGEAQVAAGLSPGMMPFEIGTVSASGTFSVTLDEELWERLQASAEAGAESGDWVAQSKTIGEVFTCQEGGVEIRGDGKQPLENLTGIDGTLGVASFQNEVLYGYFMAGSSIAFWETVSALGMLGDTPGYYLDWLYVEAPVRVEGSCTTTVPGQSEEGPFEQVTAYDLELEPGWSLVKYEVATVHANPDGPDQASRVNWISLEALPGNVQYLWIPEEK